MCYVKCDVCGKMNDVKKSFSEEHFSSLTKNKPIGNIVRCECGRLIFLKPKRLKIS
jgi:hypothetical protein